MAKLTKQQSKLHAQACALLEKDELTYDEKIFVLENWHEGARHDQTYGGAFFTPLSYALTFAIEVPGRKIIDLCAGIGMLAYAVLRNHPFKRDEDFDITCVEINPDYIEVGKKILPHARWIQADVLDLPPDIGNDYHCAISNPPFGARKADGSRARYTGKHFEYKVIDLASTLARYGVFIVPQNLSPYQMSGRRSKEEVASRDYEQFVKMTGITFEPNCGIDAAVYKDEWHDASVMTEVAIADFERQRIEAQEQEDAQKENDLEDSFEVDMPAQGVLFPGRFRERTIEHASAPGKSCAVKE
jgi:predicted RNA methylase